jgi:mono/diheme cytochrome c family protein
MRSIRFKTIVVVLALSASAACIGALAQTAKSQADKAPAQKSQTAQKPKYAGIGTTAVTKEDEGNLALTAGMSGKDLPPGSGTAKLGEPVYLARCAMCHGVNGEGVPWAPGELSPISAPRLVGGGGKGGWDVLDFPFPEVLFNTIAVEMPMFRPGTLPPDQVYAITAFILSKNGLIKQDDVMNRETLAKVKMPGRDVFPNTDAPYMNMQARGCYKPYGVCIND